MADDHPARWTVDDDARKPTLVLDAGSNDPLRFTREHMGEVTDAEFAALVALVRAHEACTHTIDTLQRAREWLVPLGQNEYGDITYDHGDGEACETHCPCPAVQEAIGALIALFTGRTRT